MLVVLPGFTTVTTPPHVHMQVSVALAAGLPPIITVGLPGVQGPGMTGTQGIGVRVPMAAAVAAAT